MLRGADRSTPTPISTSGWRRWRSCCSPATDPKLRAEFDRLTGIILAAQEPSGYLNTYWIEERTAKRFTEMYRSHELYCMGHLLQAAIAYYRATGQPQAAGRAASVSPTTWWRTSVPQKRPALTGHPEFEMALVELYRTTGDRTYLDFAGYLLERRGTRAPAPDRTTRCSTCSAASRSPRARSSKVTRCAPCTLRAGPPITTWRPATPLIWKTLETLWNDLVNRKMYITGGVGSREAGEAFGDALRTAQRAGVRRKLRGHRQHDVELAHAAGVWARRASPT